MDVTNQSLLHRAGQGQEAAWTQFADLYRPMIQTWLARSSIAAHDLDDLTQDVLVTLVRELPSFVHSGNAGAFRRWLRTITVNRARYFWRANRCRPVVPGGSDLAQMIDALEDPASALSQQWDQEHDQFLLRGLLDELSGEFEPQSLQAFRRLMLDGVAPADVAAELNLSVAGVYTAKSRVFRRLRQLAAGLLD